MIGDLAHVLAIVQVPAQIVAALEAIDDHALQVVPIESEVLDREREDCFSTSAGVLRESARHGCASWGIRRNGRPG